VIGDFWCLRFALAVSRVADRHLISATAQKHRDWASWSIIGFRDNVYCDHRDDDADSDCNPGSSPTMISFARLKSVVSVEACRINLALVRSASRKAILAQSFFRECTGRFASVVCLAYTETALAGSFKRICEWRQKHFIHTCRARGGSIHFAIRGEGRRNRGGLEEEREPPGIQRLKFRPVQRCGLLKGRCTLNSPKAHARLAQQLGIHSQVLPFLYLQTLGKCVVLFLGAFFLRRSKSSAPPLDRTQHACAGAQASLICAQGLNGIDMRSAPSLLSLYV
jgi:hypothetical protein